MTIAPPDYQIPLLRIAPSWNITKNAQARNAYGTVAQELVCAALKLLPIPINGNYDCCFDAKGKDVFYEIKSVRRNGKLPLYTWRLVKESRSGVNLKYAILIHNVRKSNGRHLVQEFANSGLSILVLDSIQVHKEAQKHPLRLVQNPNGSARSGYNRKGYQDGYRNLPVKALLKYAVNEMPYNIDYDGIQVQLKLLFNKTCNATYRPKPWPAQVTPPAANEPF